LMLEGRQVRLRAVERVDLPTFVKWLNDPEVTQFLESSGPMSMEAEERWYAKLQAGEDKVYSIDTKEGKLIGNVGVMKIDWKDRRAVIGIMIGEKEHWDKGYGTDAIETLVRYLFEELNMHRIYLLADERNTRAIRCYEKVGFRKEGTFREDRFRDGSYRSDIQMSILQGEWDERGRSWEIGS